MSIFQSSLKSILISLSYLVKDFVQGDIGQDKSCLELEVLGRFVVLDIDLGIPVKDQCEGIEILGIAIISEDQDPDIGILYPGSFKVLRGINVHDPEDRGKHDLNKT